MGQRKSNFMKLQCIQISYSYQRFYMVQDVTLLSVKCLDLAKLD